MSESLLFDDIKPEEAAGRLMAAVRATPLEPFDAADVRINLRLKLECLQETGSFKARGAWNQVSQLTEEQRAQRIVATSSGNHGRALAWAAARARLKATIYMPDDAYPNKVEACRNFGAEVVLCPGRQAAEEACRQAVETGAILIHPYDSARTIEGAGTVGFEIANGWPEVEVVVVPVGGGGLIAGSALAIHRALGSGVAIFGAEPNGAPTLRLALEANHPVVVDQITTSVQGLCPLEAGALNTAIACVYVRAAIGLGDEEIFAAQQRLVIEGGWIVEPAGAAAVAVVHGGHLPNELLEGRTEKDPLRVVAIVSGGNPDPDQLMSLTA